jgi:Rps23 Pro-64 3,4-dihydroxylase Tpa1-like proline 4-hydroxylase|tara:strand:- start:63 stop:641 length:579 start_codon:yes stop_codon:yes gene_type:complete
MEKKTLGLEKFIKVQDNFITPRQVSAIIRTFKDKKFEHSKIILENGERIVDTTNRNVAEYWLQENRNHTETHWLRYLQRKLFLFSQNFLDEFQLDISIKNIEGITILKYEAGGFYKRHVDSCKSAFRELSAIIMLNDDYEGGSLKFYDSGNEIKEVTKKAGRLIMWPSCSLFPHQAIPVKKGTRFVIVSWMS